MPISWMEYQNASNMNITEKTNNLDGCVLCSPKTKVIHQNTVTYIYLWRFCRSLGSWRRKDWTSNPIPLIKLNLRPIKGFPEKLEIMFSSNANHIASKSFACTIAILMISNIFLFHKGWIISTGYAQIVRTARRVIVWKWAENQSQLEISNLSV